MASLSEEEEQLHLALALSASEAALPPPPAPPATLNGAELRQLSETQKWGGPRRVGPNTRSDQNKCHRIENATLVKAYNSTTDDAIKREIIKFNLSKDNAFHGVNNEDHTTMERAFRSAGKGPTATQHSRKADMLLTAISNLNYYKEDYSEKTVVHILKTLKNESPVYNEIIADLKKSSFSTPAIKAVIDEARQENENEKHRPSNAKPSRAASAEEEEGEKERRSEAAKKGWGTRRRNEAAASRAAEAEAATRCRNEARAAAASRAAAAEAEAATRRRSEAAMRGWETRRQNQPVVNSYTGSSLHTFSGVSGGPTKADGTPDMRYKVNRG